jgi:putative two-component system response regulator
VSGVEPNRGVEENGKAPTPAPERRSARRTRKRPTRASPPRRKPPVAELSDDQLESERFQALLELALAAERTEGTAEHPDRVARTAFRLACQLGLPQRDAELIYQAAPLHDLGKIAIPRSLLLKPGRLSAIEFERVKTHTTAGAGLLTFSDLPLLRVAREIALTHHEHWDGSGYPAGLRGEEIPISGRIVALADVFDVLTHSRAYDEAWTVERAVEEFGRARGMQFDPAVVDAFLELDLVDLVELTSPHSASSTER